MGKCKLMLKKIVRAAILALLLFALVCGVLPPLFRSMESGTGALPSASGAARVRSLDDNTDALCWRLRLIETAQEDIVLSTFAFLDDESGQDIMAALYHAAARGVRVRILVDGLDGQQHLPDSAAFQALLSCETAEARFYNPLSIRLWQINYRMHDKYLIADDTAYILGGRNTKDLSLVADGNLDRDVLVYESGADEPGTLAQLRQYFEEIWALPVCKSPRRARSVAEPDVLAARYETLSVRFPAVFETVDWTEETLPCDSLTLLTGLQSAGNKAPVVWEALCGVMERGTDILIQTPYVVCGGEMYRQLQSLCVGRQVSILTNAPETGANLFGCADYRMERDNILETGVKLYEWAGDRSMHSKTVLVDDRISIVGSYNLDMRSTYLDTEMMLVIESAAFNAQLRAQTEQRQAESRCVLPDGTVEYGAAYVPPEYGFGRRAFHTVCGVLVRPFRCLL